MQKMLKVIFLMLIVLISGCETEPQEDQIESKIDEFYRELESDFPLRIADDYQLPTLDVEELSILYYQNNNLLEDGIINYQASPTSLKLDLTVVLEYQGISKSYAFTVEQVADEQLFNEENIEELFAYIFTMISKQIPNILYSDITLPTSNIPGVELSYLVDHSYIFNNRLIFTYPDEDEPFHLTVNVTFKQQTRTIVLPVIMSAFEALAKIPQIHIVTENNQSIENKETYVHGTLTLYDYDEHNNQNVLLNSVGIGIRLRGNSTLFMPKKPYKIKFNEKQYMFTDYKEKDWVLLANFSDQTLIRNGLAYQMANDLNMEFAPMVRYVDVYINGVYQGNYMLSDQIEVTNDRVDIEEHSADIDTGYLIEYDMRIYDEGLDTTSENYFMIDGIPFVIKSPKADGLHYSESQYEFIESYFQNLMNVLKNQEDYSHLIDEASFVDWFIVNEVFKNVDSGYSSIYFYKDKGSPLKMGPVWDFDLSSGNYGHLQEDLRGPEGWYTSRYDKNSIFHYLMQYNQFQTALKNRWNEVYEEVTLKMIDGIYPMADSIARSRYDNFEEWAIIGTYEDWFIAPEILGLDTYEEQLYFLRDFLIKRIAWLDKEINLFD